MARTLRPRLPRYVLAKRRADGRIAYFFSPPSWAMKPNADDPRRPCTVKPEPLGTDFATAKARAENVLLPAFESWRTMGKSDLTPVRGVAGTFDWLSITFQSSLAFKGGSRSTQRGYRQGLDLVASHVLKDGTTVGSRRIADFDPAFADAIYAKLTKMDDAGNASRRPFINAAMRACRRAWNVVWRLQPKDVPANNPFAKMGLKARGAGEAKTDTATATWDHLLQFRQRARKMGEAGLATAALVAWEWLQRGEHVFGAFDVKHYRPPERPDMVRVVHPKTGEEVWWPLFTEPDRLGRREPLFPDLMAELDAIKATMLAGLMIRRARGGKPFPLEKSGDLSYMRQRVREIMDAAGLPEDLSFTSFRHGGMTETGEAEMTDREITTASRHKSPRILPTYVKATRKILISGALKRRAARTKSARLSE